MSNQRSIIVFDGDCVLCQKSMHFIAIRDLQRRYLFAASQSTAGRELLSRLRVESESRESIILVEGMSVFVRSTAVLKVLSTLRWPWRVLGVLLVLPKRWRDWCYCAYAKRRRLVSTQGICKLPVEDVRNRLLRSEASDLTI